MVANGADYEGFRVLSMPKCLKKTAIFASPGGQFSPDLRRFDPEAVESPGTGGRIGDGLFRPILGGIGRPPPHFLSQTEGLVAGISADLGSVGLYDDFVYIPVFSELRQMRMT